LINAEYILASIEFEKDPGSRLGKTENTAIAGAGGRSIRLPGGGEGGSVTPISNVFRIRQS
jgi:hypothetical protein